MLANNVAIYFLKALRSVKGSRDVIVINAQRYIDSNVSLLLLPDAMRMYGPRQIFHFTQHPVTHKISTVKFNTKPSELNGIKDAFKANLQPDIPKCVIDEMSHPEVFEILNPNWKKTAYITHLYQDCAWDECIRKMVDVSERFEDKFTYRKNDKVVDGSTFLKEIELLNNVFFIAISKKIEYEFGVLINETWFENFVYFNLLRKYDKGLAENTWSHIKLPNVKEDIEFPDFISEEELNQLVEYMVKETILF